jgi:DNA-binding beta-propeller fold protein YncE
MGNRLWINNDIDNTTTVINPVSMQVRATISTPADLVAMGGKPHDVFFDPSGRFAYVSVLGVSGPNDYIVKFDAHQFREVARVAVGKDPHLFADDINKLLYVPCQNSNGIYVVNRLTMQVRSIIPFNGAHGIFMPDNGKFVYATDISGAGLGVFSTFRNAQIGSTVSTPFPTPHNLSINARGDKLFVTHSGATADKVTVYTLSPGPSFVTSVTVGTNPFGLVYYRY